MELSALRDATLAPPMPGLRAAVVVPARDEEKLEELLGKYREDFS